MVPDSLLHSGLGLIAEGGEGGGLVDGHFAEDLAVQVDAGLFQAVHEGGIVHAVGLAAGADAGDPQAAEISLFQAAADVAVAAGLHHGLVGHFVVLALGAPVALGQTQDLVSMLARHHRAFYSCHI